MASKRQVEASNGGSLVAVVIASKPHSLCFEFSKMCLSSTHQVKCQGLTGIFRVVSAIF